MGNLTCHEAVWLIFTCFQVFSVHHCIVQILNNGQHWVSGSSWGINTGGGGMHLNPSTEMLNIRSSSHPHLCSEFWATLGYMRLSLSTPPPWKRLFPLNLVDVPPVFHTVCCIASWLLRYNYTGRSLLSAVDLYCETKILLSTSPLSLQFYSLFLSAPGNQKSAFCVWGHVCTVNRSRSWNVWSFVLVFFHLE